VGVKREEENKRYKQAFSFGVCIIAWIVILELVFVVLLNRL
jgi:t-SNARE complex subunit (syntaxin)